MVSHESVENMVTQIISADKDADGEILCVITGIADEAKGESLVLLTAVEIDLKSLGEKMRTKGVPNLWIPKQTKLIDEIPLLGTGKLDLRKIKELTSKL